MVERVLSMHEALGSIPSTSTSSEHAPPTLLRFYPRGGFCAYTFLTCVTFNRRRRWRPIPVLLPGKSHGRRSLVGCSPWGREESDTTERLHFHFSLSCIGEGNGNPLHCSCLEDPSDREACRAAVHAVRKSQTPLTSHARILLCSP